MALSIPIATWLRWAEIAQPLSSADNSSDRNFGGGALTNYLPRLLYIVRKAIAWDYDNNTTDPTIYATGTFLYQLIGPYINAAQNILNNLNLVLPVLSGPTNIITNVGVPATFSVSLINGSLPVTYQWYFNGIAIPGATGSSYIVTNPQPSSSPQIYQVSATNGAGTVFSQQATLTVVQPLTGGLYYTATDPGPTLIGGSNPFNYQEFFSITSGQPWSIPLPSGSSPFMYLVIQGPSSESVKTTWRNSQLNFGTIPDSVFNTPVIINGLRIYYTRNPVSMDTTQPLTLS